jgi:hypothetical protein
MTVHIGVELAVELGRHNRVATESVKTTVGVV